MTRQDLDRLSLLGEQDLYLFNEGSHVRLWEHLGAHPLPEGGVVFGVWAPSAERVSGLKRAIDVMTTLLGPGSIELVDVRDLDWTAQTAEASVRKFVSEGPRIDALWAANDPMALGAMPALRVLWGLHLVLDLLFVGYVAALVRVRNIAAEREMKLRFMPAPRRPGPAIDLRDPRPAPALALRRSAN